MVSVHCSHNEYSWRDSVYKRNKVFVSYVKCFSVVTFPMSKTFHNVFKNLLLPATKYQRSRRKFKFRIETETYVLPFNSTPKKYCLEERYSNHERSQLLAMRVWCVWWRVKCRRAHKGPGGNGVPGQPPVGKIQCIRKCSFWSVNFDLIFFICYYYIIIYFKYHYFSILILCF